MSLPDSGCLTGARARSRLWEVSHAVRALGRVQVCHPGAVLSSMRNSSGGPNLRMRLLAVVVALLLAGPLTLALIRGAAAAVRLAV